MRTWTPIVDGDDLVIGDFIHPVTASWFGGPSDSGDSGETASGVPNHAIGVLGVALPMRTSNGRSVPGCADSPLLEIPWQTKVIVNAITRNAGPVPVVGSQLTLPLIDVGPDTYLNRPLDICPFPFVRLGGDLKVGLLHVFLRIVGGSKYLAT